MKDLHVRKSVFPKQSGTRLPELGGNYLESDGRPVCPGGTNSKQTAVLHKHAISRGSVGVRVAAASTRAAAAAVSQDLCSQISSSVY